MDGFVKVNAMGRRMGKIFSSFRWWAGEGTSLVWVQKEGWEIEASLRQRKCD